MPKRGGMGEGGGASHGKEGASGGCGEVGDRDWAHLLNISAHRHRIDASSYLNRTGYFCLPIF